VTVDQMGIPTGPTVSVREQQVHGTWGFRAGTEAAALGRLPALGTMVRPPHFGGPLLLACYMTAPLCHPPMIVTAFAKQFQTA
jgi:hypothetical protein